MVEQTLHSVKGPDLPEGPADLLIIGHEDGSVTRLAKWPEGLLLWHEGEIVWRQWLPYDINKSYRTAIQAMHVDPDLQAFKEVFLAELRLNEVVMAIHAAKQMGVTLSPEWFGEKMAALVEGLMTMAPEAPAEGAGEAMTEREVRQWIDTCNHEPARQVLRDYLAIRARSSAPEAREREAVAKQWRAVDEQGPRTSWRELDWRSEAEVRDWEASHTVEYRDLYTHPAAPSADHAELTRLAEAAGEEALGNLLAVIHGDGGHRALEVGTKQAALEAEKIVARLLSSAPEAWLDKTDKAMVDFLRERGEDFFSHIHKAMNLPPQETRRRLYALADAGLVHLVMLGWRPGPSPSADKLPKASGVMSFREGALWSVQAFYETQKDADAAHAALAKGEGDEGVS